VAGCTVKPDKKHVVKIISQISSNAF